MKASARKGVPPTSITFAGGGARFKQGNISVVVTIHHPLPNKTCHGCGKAYHPLAFLKHQRLSGGYAELYDSALCMDCQPPDKFEMRYVKSKLRMFLALHDEAGTAYACPDGPVGVLRPLREFGLRDMGNEELRLNPYVVGYGKKPDTMSGNLLAPPAADTPTAEAKPGRPDTLRGANAQAAETAVSRLLQALGHDLSREGLRETPRRVAKMLADLCTPEPFTFTVFDAEGMNEMIVQSNIPLQSLCEHHMLPFVGTAAVCYIPKGKIVGLSKLSRAVRYCSRGLQNQERITKSIADMLEQNLQPMGVGVVLRARHLCMELRGVRDPDVWTTTSCMRGALMEDAKARAEFLALAGTRT